MTDRRYLEDSSVREFEATVVDVRGDAVVLDATYFYPTSGGQPHDTGRLEAGETTYTVVAVEMTDVIEHHVDRDADSIGLESRTIVTGVVDDDRRQALSRYHTAQHLLSAVLLDEYDARTTGNQLYVDRARLDCEYDRFEHADLVDIEARLNDLVTDELPVRWYTMARDAAEAELDTDRTRIDLLPESITELRIVEIGGAGPRGQCEHADAASEPLDRTACAGTHVTQTGDIGAFDVVGRETAGAGAERIRFELE